MHTFRFKRQIMKWFNITGGDSSLGCQGIFGSLLLLTVKWFAWTAVWQVAYRLTV